MNMMQCIKNIIKAGVKTNTIDVKNIEVEFLGKKQPAFLYIPYGMQINPSNDNITLLLSEQANENNLIAMVTDRENRDELDDGEVAIGIPSLKARLVFRDDDKIYFKIGDTEGGDFLARFNELKDGFDQLKDDYNDLINKYNAHIHITTATIGLGPAVGVISPTTSSGSVSTASIDSAKIDEIEVPS